MKKTIIQKVMAYIHDYDMDAENLKHYIWTQYCNHIALVLRKMLKN